MNQLLFLIFLMFIGTESFTQNSNSSNLNISILVDLSDRISTTVHPNPSMEYYDRDIGYIKTIAQAFTDHVSKKRVPTINDRMQVFFEPPPENSRINSLANKLKIHLTRNNITQEVLFGIDSLYVTTFDTIYSMVTSQDSYFGSDIWRFFTSRVKDNCIKSDYRNILIVITDGYIYHQNNRINDENKFSYFTAKTINTMGLSTSEWKKVIEEKKYGLIVQNTDLENLDVLVLGVNPDPGNPYSEDIIKFFWSDWLNAMGVEKMKIKTAELPINLEEVVKEFILNN